MGMLSNMFSEINMPSAKTVVSTTASIAASAMVIRTIARDLVPYELQNYAFSSVRGLFRSFSSEVTLIIEEFTGIVGNQIYDAAEIYLGSKMSPFTRKFKVNMPDKETKISTSMAENQEIVHVFNGVKFKWKRITIEVESKRPSYPGQSSSKSEVRFFELKFHKKHKQIVFDSYFPFLLEQSKKVKEDRKTLKIHTLNSEHTRRYTGSNNAWNSITLEHPSTFDTLAIDPDVKKTIMEDLERFVQRKDFYKKVGKAWKRGYLLYGPPGTGKSSLIAAMANYLHFDIYDLELSDIHENAELRRLLIGTANRCILVVEDIDCSLELEDRQDQKIMKMLQTNQVRQAQTVNIVKQQRSSQVTLSGLLNFIDGLWSSCGDERIIVFTTNHKERLDPALLRPGRMDVHIHMSYCTFSSFKTLALNYLGINTHPLFYEIENLLGETTVTPAEVGEQLLKSEGHEETLQGLIEFLVEKKREKREIEEMEESKRKKEEEIEKKNEEKEKESVGNEATPEQ